MRYPPYPTYKRTRTQWLGKIPSHWTTQPLWSMFHREKTVGMPNEELLSVFRDYGVIPKSQRDNLNKTAENRDIYQFVDTGWLVTNRMKAWQGSVGISPQRGIVSGHYIVFRPIHQANDAFLNLLMRSDLYTLGYQTLSRGVRPGQAEIDNDQYRTMAVLLPPIEEQKAIVRWVISETAQIDELIGKQNALIELLGERRKAVITQAVTKGLDVNAPMKVSGVDWLGQVPSAWAIGRVSYFGTVNLGKMVQPAPSAATDILAPYVRAANVQPDGVVDLSSANMMWFRLGELSGLQLDAGDIVVVEGGVGGYGRSAYLSESVPGWGFQNSINRIRMHPGNDGRYFNYVLLMARFVGFIAVYCTGVSMPHLTAEKLERIVVPAPPEEVQREIADYLDQQTAQINELVEKAKATMALLRERRSALITAAVTGNIDVRGAA